MAPSDPEGRTVAMTVREAKQNLTNVRALHGSGSGYGLQAFQQLSQAYAAEGRHIDDLDQRSPVEEERFFASTIQGPDGHVYWQGWRYFTRNDKALRSPVRWWWEFTHNPISRQLSVKPTCGDPACINPEHCQLEDQSRRLRRYTDERLIGGLQVLAMRLGRTPTEKDWRESGLDPAFSLFAYRFGSWIKALDAAGLDPIPSVRRPIDYIRALQAARALIGHWPTLTDFNSVTVRTHLKDRKLPTSARMVYEKIGPGWEDALRRAGKR